jgi:hypothetical protein
MVIARLPEPLALVEEVAQGAGPAPFLFRRVAGAGGRRYDLGREK